MGLDEKLSDDAGSAPQKDWFSNEDLARIDELIGKLQTSDTREGISRYHAMAEGYLLGLLDCYHVSAEHHDAVRQHLHNLAIARLKVVKVKARK
ncbi:hypothetical protein ACIPL1_26225 [Pseudomonas sp. NPDC090202]|uniref:hypothetical protein n=1 Tax=unclassified Pseudomonas TaxID=196821 RepID=UPI0038102FC2